MTAGGTFDEERLAELLARLRSAPEAWARVARELPLVRRGGIDELVARAERDPAFADALVADPESALAREGIPAEPRVLEELLRRLAH